MATPNRSAILSKTHKVLKQYYEPILPVDGRSVLEHFLYGTCLENTPYDKADLAFASMIVTYLLMEFGESWPQGTKFLTMAAAALVFAGATVRRVSPVIAKLRGILPQET